jgi:hypothetical protein
MPVPLFRNFTLSLIIYQSNLSVKTGKIGFHVPSTTWSLICMAIHRCSPCSPMATMQGFASHLHCRGVYDIVSWVKLPKVLGAPKVLTDSQFLPCPSVAEFVGV